MKKSIIRQFFRFMQFFRCLLFFSLCHFTLGVLNSLTVPCVHVEFQLKCLGKTLFEIIINSEFGITDGKVFTNM